MQPNVPLKESLSVVVKLTLLVTIAFTLEDTATPRISNRLPLKKCGGNKQLIPSSL